ncbi:acyltransferase (plasmid) [Brasilonema octagenarum UFV-E1]|uniref:Acyltransferase n=1 Tax=Brasilonema sennae CENA114 TaxID=415709 RepID=A0A856MMG0_9CYAN|nr:acyltransferase [Brasilonema sennae]QDL12623.1 acyltransferase [Brasilonema sennae CENA114]QDL19018.1 acyltransferase [Brasilonema octagenarum UFV-E1]
MNPLTEKPPRQKLHLHYLDGLRGIAALYVVAVHIEPSLGEKLPTFWLLFQNTLRYGAFSVVVFIVLSGYVLMLPVTRSQSGFVSGGLLEYFKRRWRRILPPYYATLLACLLLAFAIFLLEKFTTFQWDEVAGKGPFSPDFSLIDVLSHLFLVHNFARSTSMTINPPMWSVATEWQLYFLFPLLLLPIWRRFGLLSVVIAGFSLGILPFYILHDFSMATSSWFIGLFTLGMAAAEIGFSQKLQLIALKKSLPWGIMAITLTIVAFITEWKRLGLPIWIGQSFFGASAACLFIYCTQFVISGKKLPHVLGIFEHPWVITLGAFSYSLYLTHGPVITMLRYFLYSLNMTPFMFATTSYLMGIAVSLLIAYWFYLIFERPFMSNFNRRK